MIVLPCLPMIFSGSYVTYVFLLMFIFSLFFLLSKVLGGNA